MGVAGSPPAERAGGRHRQIAGASDTKTARPSGGHTRIALLRAHLAKNTGCVGACNKGNGPPMQELVKRELLILRELVAANVPSNLEAPCLDGQSVRESGMSYARFRSPSPTRNNWWLFLRLALEVYTPSHRPQRKTRRFTLLGFVGWL